MHARAPVGTRVEETADLFADIEKAVRQIIPPDELDTLVDNIGMPVSSINMTYNNTGTIGSQDGDIQIGLKEDHRPTADYVRTLREELPARFPGVTFSFLPADIISQILNFGAPAPIELQVRGPKLDGELRLRAKPARRLRHVPGIVDARIQQSPASPASTSMSIARARSMSASPSATSPTAWSSTLPAQPGRADLLAQPRQRRDLPDRDADAAIPGRFARRAAQPADHRSRRAAAGARRHRRRQARGGSAVVYALQHPAGGADLRDHPGPRSRRRRRRRAADHRRHRERIAEGADVVLLGQVRP